MADRSSADVDLIFRLASHEDYDEVMQISEGIYSDRDYLPAYFHSYIDDADVTVFLALVEDQVVGLRASKITEGGTAFISKAARVAPAWRGQGIDGKLSLYEQQWVRKNRPIVKYKRIVTSSHNFMTRSLKKRMRYLFSLPFIGYQCGPDLWWRQDPAQLAQLDTTVLPDVVPLQDADDNFCTAVQKCLPTEACGSYDGKPIVLVDWDPYTLCPTNLKHLGASSTLWTLQSEGETSLSIVTAYPAAAGMQLCIDSYAKEFPTWKKHILKHLHDASLRFKSDNICVMMSAGLFELETAAHQFCSEVLQMEALYESTIAADIFECEV